MVFRVNSRYPIHQLRDEMDRLMRGFAGRACNGAWPPAERGQHAANLWEDGHTLMVEMEVPGVSGDQLDVSVAGGELSIEVKRPEVQQEGVLYHRRERPSGDFQRVLRLPADVDSQRVEARLHDGVLRISLPKADSAKPRKIKVASTS